MTDVEKRRIKLLQETRNNYSDKYSPPAIHPRYQVAYRSVYGTEESSRKHSFKWFLIRAAISVFIFLLVYIMDDTMQKQEIQTVVQTDLLGEQFPFFIK